MSIIGNREVLKMAFDINLWVVETIAFKLATRQYDIDQTNGGISGKIATEDSLGELYTSWPNLSEQVRDYLSGYYPAYKEGRDLGKLSSEKIDKIADNP
jgi:hypothetical protein